jgi:hypothetical protein
MPKRLPALCVNCRHRERYGRFLRCRVCQGPRFSAGSRKGWKPRRRNIEAKAWAASQPADRKRPDLDALMADLDAPERKALQALENAKGFLAERRRASG